MVWLVKGFSIGPFDYRVQDATLIVLDIGRGLRPMEASPRARPSGEGVLSRILSIRRMRF